VKKETEEGKNFNRGREKNHSNGKKLPIENEKSTLNLLLISNKTTRILVLASLYHFEDPWISDIESRIRESYCEALPPGSERWFFLTGKKMCAYGLSPCGFAALRAARL